MSGPREATVIELLRVRILTTLAHVRAELNERERRMGPSHATIWLSLETKWWSHDENAGKYRARIAEKGVQILEPNFLRADPRGFRIVEAPNWRDFLDIAETRPTELFGRFGLAAFMAAHGDNCLHPFQPIAWAATDWNSYNHALARNLRSAA